ncbi:PD-(D/E)XK nuclease family protein [Bradyrhizobium sp. 146]|uniref:PD-(D/E)XK nuclease family protein n=1 Tax=Bradyrhizobium sp. 146 TaxID=2782622 RepID=UPI001FF8DAFD|nr:PD-(D/E)XK nuclease family protein [Bradyrhizobium sp. 146]
MTTRLDRCQRTSRPERLAAGRDQIGKLGDIVSESTGDFISVRLGDFVGIRKHGIELVPKQAHPDGGHAARQVTGHIDFLQVRNGCLHILDYKPDARTNQPFAQLTVYALALTRLVPGLRLFNIKCAWFNETAYNEFYPRKLLL